MFVVYAVDDPKSFTVAKKVCHDLINLQGVHVTVVENKADERAKVLSGRSVVPVSEGRKFAHAKGYNFLQLSTIDPNSHLSLRAEVLLVVAKLTTNSIRREKSTGNLRMLA